VALVYNGGTQAVMMATPADLEDFATGFSISEGIIRATPARGRGRRPRHPHRPRRRGADVGDAERRGRPHRPPPRHVGPVGCGLCGIDSLSQALRPLPALPEAHVGLTVADIKFALGELRDWQPLHDETRAVHAAGFWQPGQGILLAREDVGRHNALDKLIGALARAAIDPALGAIALTSRLSVEMIQKAVMAGCPILLAVSAPTARAVRIAEGANLTLASISRGDVQVFTHPPPHRPPPRGGRALRPALAPLRRSRPCQARPPTSSSAWRTRSPTSSPPQPGRHPGRGRGRPPESLLGAADAPGPLRPCGRGGEGLSPWCCKPWSACASRPEPAASAGPHDLGLWRRAVSSGCAGAGSLADAAPPRASPRAPRAPGSRARSPSAARPTSAPAATSSGWCAPLGTWMSPIAAAPA
jgi:FdhD protein